MDLDIFDIARTINSKSDKKWTLKINKSNSIVLYLKTIHIYTLNNGYYYIYDEFGETKLKSDELIKYLCLNKHISVIFYALLWGDTSLDMSLGGLTYG